MLPFLACDDFRIFFAYTKIKKRCRTLYGNYAMSNPATSPSSSE